MVNRDSQDQGLYLRVKPNSVLFIGLIFPSYNTNTNKIYIAPGILKRIRVQMHGVCGGSTALINSFRIFS